MSLPHDESSIEAVASIEAIVPAVDDAADVVTLESFAQQDSSEAALPESNAITPFWRKVGDAPTFAPEWYANQGEVTQHVYYDDALTPAENGALLRDVISNLSAGDHIQIHAGTYSIDSYYTIQASGTESQPVTIAGAPGEEVTITRFNATQNVMNIFPSQYLIIEGLHLRGGSTGLKIQEVSHFMLHNVEISETKGNGVAANSKDTSYLYFIDNEIHDTGGNGEGLYLGAHDGSKITHNSYVIGNYIYNLNASDVGQGDGIEIKDGSYAVTIKHNFVQNTNYPGIIVYRTGRGAEDRNIIEENVIINSNDTAIQATADAVIRNNLVVTNRTGFLSKPFTTVPQNLTVVNNTIVAGTDGVRTIGWDSEDAVDNVFANNVIHSAVDRPIPNGLGNATVVGNVVVTDLAATFADIQFNGTSWDPTPLPNTQLIGTADLSYLPEVDLTGRPRITGGDVGAVDYREVGGELPDPDVPADGVYGRFDFGSDTSPLGSEYTRVTQADRYDYIAPYGWISGSVGSRDRARGDDLNRDFNFVSSGSMTFVVDVPDGNYQATVGFSDQSYAIDGMQVSIEGTSVDTISTVAGETVLRTYEFEIRDRQLSLTLTRGASGFALINSLELKRVLDVGAGVLVTPGLNQTTTESLGTSTFAVQLKTRPTAQVTINLLSTDSSEGMLSQTQLVFTPDDWDQPKTVTAIGVDDSVLDGDIEYTIMTSATESEDPAYDGLPVDDINLVNLDNEVVTDRLISQFDFGTAGSPVATGYTQVTPSDRYDPAVGHGWLGRSIGGRDRARMDDTTRDFNFVASGSMTFGVDIPAGNYQVEIVVADAIYENQGMQVLVEGEQVDTLSISGGESITRTYDVMVQDGQLTLTMVRGTRGFALINALKLTSSSTPNADPGVIVRAAANQVTSENLDSTSFTVELGSAPTSPVEINLGSNNENEGTLSTGQLVFTQENWNQPQTVTVTGVDDDLVDGDIPYQVITSNTTSLDPSYQGLDVDDVSITNLDNDISATELVNRFDFGSSTSPTEAGYTKVVPTDRYDASKGFGWLSGQLGSRDRTDADDLTRDFNHVASGAMEFAVDLANGVYRISVIIGDRYYAHSGMKVSVEGELVDTLSIGPNEFFRDSYMATVSDGQLTLEIARGESGFALINSMTIERIT
ncbi:right-handed parallel beta-helix repeat-containing protein [Rubripirellula tenax]|uniref:right-handed parallel beta-helix repeat-containing protein n=1 Tax=Rubripirellula tenax TaxID=2528015 RepID=UPI0016445EE8|nr:right-handed parallel beta-helix repeat-containing protein [Rubripirellula tenax]